MGRVTGRLRRRSWRRFTLIELLVVVAIIAILAAMLLPVLSRARELAYRAMCLSNMKQLGLAYHLYAEENREFVPLWETNAGKYYWGEWYKLYYPYVSGSLLWSDEAPCSLKNRSPNWLGKTVPVFDCPLTTNNVWFHWDGSPVYGNHPKTFDYLTNSLNKISNRSASDGNFRLTDLDQDGFLLIESYQYDGFHSDTLADPAYMCGSKRRMNCTRLSGTGSVQLKDDGRRSPGVHHGGGSNVLFPDGHARWAAGKEYLLNFHRPWVETESFTLRYILN